MQNKELRIGVLLSYISRVIQILIGLLYTPLMIRILGQADYGLYNMSASIVSYLGVLNLGLGSSYIKFYSEIAEDERVEFAKLNGMFLLIFTLLGIVTILAGMIIIYNIDFVYGKSLSTIELNRVKILLVILIINLAISFPILVFSSYIQANEQFIFQNSLLIIRQISSPLVSLPLLLVGFGSIGMIIGMTFVNILIEVVAVIYSFKKLNIQFTFKNINWLKLKEISNYSFFIFINMIVDQINQNVDKTIMGRYIGSIATAIYALGEMFELMFQQLSTSVSSVFTPRIHKMISSGVDSAELTDFFTRIGRIQFIILSIVFSGFIFFGRQFIGIWAGEDYYDSYPIALILMATIMIPLIQNVGIEIQRAMYKHKFRAILYVFIAVINLIITIPLVQSYGGIGAAIGTAASYLFGNGLVMNIYYHREIGLDMLYFWKEIISFIPAYIVPIVYGVFVNVFVDLYNIRNLIIAGIFYVIVLFISLWMFGINEYEKSFIKSMLWFLK